MNELFGLVYIITIFTIIISIFVFVYRKNDSVDESKLDNPGKLLYSERCTLRIGYTRASFPLSKIYLFENCIVGKSLKTSVIKRDEIIEIKKIRFGAIKIYHNSPNQPRDFRIWTYDRNNFIGKLKEIYDIDVIS